MYNDDDIDEYDENLYDCSEDEEIDEEDLPEECDEDEAEPKPSKSTLLNLLKGEKKKKNYYDEELVNDLIINHYQPYLVYGINEKGKRVCIDRSNVPRDVEKEIMANLFLIVNAIINKYSYWRFEPMDDLQAEALGAVWKYLPNYTPNKGTSFNLFSIIAKMHLRNFTTKNLRHRLTTDVDLCYDVSAPKAVNYDLFFEDLEKTFLDIIDHHYIGKKRKLYVEFTSILMEYLVANKKVVGKNDLLASFKGYGYKSTDYKKFIEEISKYKEEFYKYYR